MFITKKHLSRRTILKGAGVNLALPFLSAMVPASTALAQTAANPKIRAGFFYIPHGAIMFNTKFGAEWDRWTPSGSGASYKLNEITSPMEPFKKRMTSFGNLENAAAAGSVHVRNPATWLSATLPQGNNMSTTLDQVMTKFISQDTQYPSLELSSETTVQVAAGNGGPFTTLSFRDEHTPLPMEYNPRKIFLRVVRRRRQSAGARRDGPPEEQYSGPDPRPYQLAEGRPGQRGQGHSRRVSRERA